MTDPTPTGPPEHQQETFQQAVFDDPEMKPEDKIHWLKICADEWLEKNAALERRARETAQERDSRQAVSLAQLRQIDAHRLAIRLLGHKLKGIRRTRDAYYGVARQAQEARDALAAERRTLAATVETLTEALRTILANVHNRQRNWTGDVYEVVYLQPDQYDQARTLLVNLPAAAAQQQAQREAHWAKVEAFIMAYDRFAECVAEFPNDPGACGEWFDAVETKRATLADGAQE